MPWPNFKKEIQNICRRGLRSLKNTQNMVFLGCCFAEDGHEIYKYLTLMCIIALFYSLLRLSITFATVN